MNADFVMNLKKGYSSYRTATVLCGRRG